MDIRFRDVLISALFLLGAASFSNAGCVDESEPDFRFISCQVKVSRNFIVTVSGRNVTISWQAYQPRFKEKRNEKYSLIQKFNNTHTILNAAPPLAGSNIVNLVNDGVYTFCMESRGLEGDVVNNSDKRVLVARQTCQSIAITSTPASINVPTKTAADFSVSWSASTGATRYELYRRNASQGAWQILYSGNATSQLQSALENGPYQYKVNACTANMCSSGRLSGEVVMMRVPPTPTLISFLPVSLACSQIPIVSWSAATGANRYQLLQRKRRSGSEWSLWTSLISEQAGASYTVTHTDSGYDYQFAVRARYVYQANQSEWSAYLYSATLRKPFCQVGTPKNLTVSAAPIALTTEAYSVSWRDASGVAQSYELQEKFNTDTWVTVQNSALLNYSVSNRARGNYCYRVRAINDDSASEYLREQCLTVKLPLPVIEITVHGATGVGANQYDSGWEGKYTVSWRVVGEGVNQATFTINGIAENILAALNSNRVFDQPDNMAQNDLQHRYQIDACNAEGCVSSAVISVKIKAYPIPAPPGNFENNSGVSHTQEYVLQWTAPQEPTTWYVLDRDGVQTQLASSVLSHTYTGAYGQTYSHAVKACFNDLKDTHCSAYTLKKSVYIRYPSPVTPSAIRLTSGPDSSGNLSLAWSSVGGYVDRYELQQQWQNGAWKNIQSSAALNASVKLAKDGANAFRVRACNVDQCSAYSVATNATAEFKQWIEVGGSVADAELPILNIAASDFSGAMPGGAQVNGGSAGYSIPIEVAPGRNGFQPQVSLHYSSKGGNGLVGVGWSLSAVSSISKCHTTFAQDGLTIPDYRYCLNGQRLMLTSAGFYGAVGSTYRTEHDDLTVVTRGKNGTKTFFRVDHPNGNVSFYGNALDVNADVSDNSRWYLVKMQNANSKNTIDYHYERQLDSTNNPIDELLLHTIFYTGSEASLGDRRVTFNYQARTDVATQYARGGKTRQTKRLATIQTYYGAQKLREYTLDYAAVSAASARSLLRSVTACAYKNAETLCQAPTVFEWTQSPAHYQVELLTDSAGVELHPGPAAVLNDHLPHGDRNGDGVNDWPRYFVNAEGVSTPHNFEMVNCRLTRYTFSRHCVEGDFDQDGRTDHWRINNGKLQIGYTTETSIRWDGITNVGMNAGPGVFSEDYLYYVGDFNGDGWSDILMHRFNNRHPRIVLYLHTQNVASPFTTANEQSVFSYSVKGAGCARDLGFGVCNTQNELQPVGDLDGNGLVDFAMLSMNESHKQSHLLINALKFTKRSLNGDVYFQNVDFKFGQFGYRANFSTFIDINNDKLPDWLGWYNDSTQLHYRMNKGNGKFGDVASLGVGVSATTLVVNGDIQNEKYVDILIPKFPFLPMDIDGDGQTEILLPNGIEVEGCHTINHRNVDEWRCGDALYGTHEVRVGASLNVIRSIPASNDTNVYRYKALYFVEDANGKFKGEYRSTNLVGGVNNVAVVDAFGNGLKDLVFNYGCENARCRMKSPKLGSVLEGKPEGIYFNRNFGATTVVAPSATDYIPVDMLIKATDAIGRESSWQYLPLSSGQVDNLYQTDHDYVDDDAHFHFSSSMYVVSQFESSNAVGGLNRERYRYRGAVYNAQGRGFAGFRAITVFDDTNGLVTETVFRQKFPFTGQAKEINTYTQAQFLSANPQLLSSVNYSWEINSAHQAAYSNYKLVQIYNSHTESYHYDLNDHMQLERSVVDVPATGVDAFGNNQEIITTIEDSFGTYVTVEQTEFDATELWPTKFTSKNVTKKAVVHKTALTPVAGTNTDKIISTHVDTWDLVHRRPISVSVYSGLENTKDGVTLITTLNEYGLPTRVEKQATVFDVNGVGVIHSRFQESDYSADGTTLAADGYFPLVQRQQASVGVTHTASIQTDAGTGKPIEVIDATGVVVSSQYDALARLIQQDRTGMPSVYTRYRSLDANAPTNAMMRVETMQAGAPTTNVYVDNAGQKLRVVTQGFDGRPVFSDVIYNERGLKTHETIPYIDEQDIATTIYSGYDALGRVSTKTSPQTNGALTTHYTYKGLTTEIQTQASVGHNLFMTRSYNALQQLMTTVDGAAGVTAYAYDGAGNPIVIKDAAGNSIYASYDDLGRKRWVDDPNQGKTDFYYNGFGEIEKQIDANGAVIHYDMDLLGRVVSRRADGSKAIYVWDTLKRGLLTSVTENGASKRFTYDHAARVTHTTLNLEGNIYVTETQYDANFGRPKAMVYPNNLTIAYDYNIFGYMLREKNAASGYVYREITEQDARGKINAANIGSVNGMNFILRGSYRFSSNTGEMLESVVSNGKANVHDLRYLASDYDSYGNILVQQNLSKWVTADGEEDPSVNFDASETFVYDELHRLVRSSLSTINGLKTINYRYDAVGNLLKKDDYASAYQYDGSNGAGPNAVTSVTLMNNTTVNFGYDNKGNQTHRNGVRQIDYSVHNMPLRITKNSAEFTFSYGADLSRYKQVRTVAGKITTTWSIGKHYEVEQTTGSTEDAWKAYISDVAIVSYDAQHKNRIRFTHRDRLGSAATFTDHNASVVARRGFDPFGAPRVGDWSPLDVPRLMENPTDVDMSTRRGFTDHEHLDEVELIHMNGRAFDYNLGRFLSVDPVIQAPGNSQSINAYSYVMNNPLAGTDPTGYVGEVSGAAQGGSIGDSIKMNMNEAKKNIGNRKLGRGWKVAYQSKSGGNGASKSSPAETGEESSTEISSQGNTNGDGGSIGGGDVGSANQVASNEVVDASATVSGAGVDGVRQADEQKRNSAVKQQISVVKRYSKRDANDIGAWLTTDEEGNYVIERRDSYISSNAAEGLRPDASAWTADFISGEKWDALPANRAALIIVPKGMYGTPRNIEANRGSYIDLSIDTGGYPIFVAPPPEQRSFRNYIYEFSPDGMIEHSKGF